MRDFQLKNKAYNYPTGAWVTFGTHGITSHGPKWYYVTLYNSRGQVADKMRCDDYRDAQAYLRSFRAIAKNDKTQLAL